MDSIPYTSTVKSILYVMICTRSDVAYALSVTSWYQDDPGESHWTIVKNILKYLRRTKELFLVYGGDDELFVKGYIDVSFITYPDDFQSQSNLVFIRWRSELERVPCWIWMSSKV